MAARQHETEVTTTPATNELPALNILQAPRYQRDKGLYEAVAKLATGEKITATATDEQQAWFNLRAELRKHGYDKAIVSGEGAAGYNVYLESIKKQPKAEG